MTNVGGGGDLGEEREGLIGLVLRKEAAEGGAGCADLETACRTRPGEDFDDLGVLAFGTELEDEVAVNLREGGELAFRFLMQCHGASVAEGVGQILTYTLKNWENQKGQKTASMS